MYNVNHSSYDSQHHPTDVPGTHLPKPLSSYYPPRSRSITPSYSPSPDGEQWPMPYVNSGSDAQLADLRYSVPMPEPRFSHTSNSGSSNAESTSNDYDSHARNPLVDLMESEKVYVDRLGLTIRRAAGAWSKKNFPPPKLDAMFRCIEACYRANKGFGQKLKDIGHNPSNPKALGDVLMRWIDDLEPAYLMYTSNFLTGFDTYPPVSANAALPGILEEMSASSKPVPPLDRWTLDALFVLPYTRLRYYRKLYTRLLRSTKEGRKDHGLLMAANDRLDKLAETVELRLEMDVSDKDGDAMSPQDQQQRELGSVISSARNDVFDALSLNEEMKDDQVRKSDEQVAVQSLHRPAAVRTTSVEYTAEMLATALSDLELRIDTERTIDLFSMQIKRCRLQMQPPTLPFERSLRSSHDVSIHFTPTATGRQIEHKRAHIFILSDLLLVAEWMDATVKAAKMQQIAKEQPERVGKGGPMPEMWLNYPPLAGKHLMVAEGNQANVLTVMVMRKETFVIHTESEIAKDRIMKDLIDCTDYALIHSTPGISRERAMASAALTSIPNAVGHTSFPSPFQSVASSSTSPCPDRVPLDVSIFANQLPSVSLRSEKEVEWPREHLYHPHSHSTGQGLTTMVALPPRGTSLPVPDQGLPEPLRQNYDQVRRPLVPSRPHIQTTASPQQPGPIPLSGNRDSVRSPSSRAATPQLSDQRAPASHSVISGLVATGAHLDQSNALLPQQHAVRHPSGPKRLVEPPSAVFQNNFPGRDSSTWVESSADDDTPPPSPEEEEPSTLAGPATVSAQMKCKVFIKQSHQQWKSLGPGKLRLYSQAKGNVKQLVVESDSASKQMLVSTIVLTDGVERVAKTGVAVEISNRGKRTGVVYMIQLRNEASAVGLFESLLVGSDRAVVR
ncbi:hypothetical protein L198_04141 [Cryptococcus wingfieldii CBS 7118]|uniref:DH domain-containing protein n=1 Tax=Cryptococcus wingfieldii CBS 7118 TaxID=1295528 RepID=A0A1E3J6E5_9TREE|nr:hypothetical protein L198_04141 [Cryptococcus wingfieldii CBS 7118]ODN96427.1 hypothetical protein L198_04141 [Cryptococcus wingfieldii CBS 7118]